MSDEKQKSINELTKNLCLFIKDKFFSPFKIDGKETTLNKYAAACNLSPSTISKIVNNKESYDIHVSTIYLIAKLEGQDPKSIFREFEDAYLNKKV